jgi:hypothetical protein
MRDKLTLAIEATRIRTGPMASSPDMGRNGAFAITTPQGVRLNVIISDGKDWSESGLPGPPWEHVSVSRGDRCPTWEEMAYVKSLFWRPDETVVQFHVPERQHINCHQFCLHLWRPVGVELPMPPAATVGPS